jgi:WD40 repeat protein
MTVVNYTELVLMACADFTVLAFDIALNQVAQYFRGHTAPITAIVSISYDPLYFASGSGESIRIWQIPTYSSNNDAAKNDNGVMTNIITNKNGVNDLQIQLST